MLSFQNETFCLVLNTLLLSQLNYTAPTDTTSIIPILLYEVVIPNQHKTTINKPDNSLQRCVLLNPFPNNRSIKVKERLRHLTGYLAVWWAGL